MRVQPNDPPDDGDIGELGPPAVELLDVVHIADPGPARGTQLGTLQ